MQNKAPKDIERLWEEKTKAAREMIKAKHFSQMKIASLALEVCEITWGGGKRDVYTLSRFAKEVGVNIKTLSNWVGVKVAVYDKLPLEVAHNASFTKLMHISTRIQRDSSKEFVRNAYEEVVNISGYDAKMARYLCDVRSIATNFENLDAARKCKKRTLQEMKYYCEIILRNINKECPKLKAKDHSIAGNFTTAKIFGAAKALATNRKPTTKNIYFNDNGKNVRVTPKDRDVINYMRKKGGYLSPTEIGMKVHGHNRSSASAWAYRTINKFVGSVIERNAKGHYRWTGG